MGLKQKLSSVHQLIKQKRIMKQKTKFSKIEVTGKVEYNGFTTEAHIGQQGNGIIDVRSKIAMVRIGDSIASISEGDYKELTDAPFRVV